MNTRKILLGWLVGCSALFFAGCENNTIDSVLLINKWQCCSYRWKYFDDERASFNSHINAANDTANKALYSDSLSILNIFEGKAKSAIIQFNNDGSSLIMFQGGTIIDSLKGRWKIFANGKRLYLPSYPQGDTLTIEKLSQDSLIFTGVEKAEPFKVVFKSVK
jgi:hypothetical protein